MGATSEGKMELIVLQAGVRELARVYHYIKWREFEIAQISPSATLTKVEQRQEWNAPRRE
jgi:hypothetical protein